MQVSNHIFAQMVGKYIEHANVLNNTSPYYKKRMDFLKHLGKCNNILKWLVVNKYDVSTRALCKQILENREHLYGILPYTGNNSYRNSLTRVVNMIENAENALRGENLTVTELE